MKRRTLFGSMATFALAMLALLVFSPSAYAVTCSNPNTGSYPADGTHLYWCAGGTVNVTPYTGAFTHAPSGTQTLLKGDAYTLYVFANKTDETTYFAASGPSWMSGNSGRCAYTGTSGTGAGSSIATSVYQSCTVSGSSFTNPNVRATFLHEMGHGLDFGILISGKHIPSTSKAFSSVAVGYSSLVIQDETYLNAQATCTVFGSVLPGTVEGAMYPTTPVCTGGVVNATFSGKTNTQILNLQSPYFFTAVGSTIFAEAWAEEYKVSDGSGGTPAVAPFADTVLQAYFACSKYALGNYAVLQVAPTPGMTQPQPYSSSQCTYAPTVAEFNSNP